MTKYKLAVLCALGIVGTSTPAFAVSYTEGVDVDTYTAAVDALGQPTRTPFVLDAGANVFTGSLLAPTDTSDFIPFFVGSNLKVTSMSLLLNNTQFLLSSPIIDLSNSFGTGYYNGPLADTNIALDLGEGFYGLLLGNGLAGTGYQVTFNARSVTAPPPAVPEPATWATLLLGFFMSGAVLRRSRAGKRSLRALNA